MNIYKDYDQAALRKAALDVQDAGNLRAIARLLVAAADYAADHCGGTFASYDDAAVILIVDKIESLVRSQDQPRYLAALDVCKAK